MNIEGRKGHRASAVHFLWAQLYRQVTELTLASGPPLLGKTPLPSLQLAAVGPGADVSMAGIPAPTKTPCNKIFSPRLDRTSNAMHIVQKLKHKEASKATVGMRSGERIARPPEPENFGNDEKRRTGKTCNRSDFRGGACACRRVKFTLNRAAGAFLPSLWRFA